MTSPCPSLTETTMLKAVTDSLSRWSGEAESRLVFEGLLDLFLELTCSEYGFIGEVFRDSDGNPYVVSYATTNIAWNEETQRLYERTRRKGMTFSRLDCLYGAVLTTGHLIISNDPSNDQRSCGLPPGHPPLNSFMGAPLLGRDGMLGMVGLANRPDGYHRDLARSLDPLLVASGTILQSHRDLKARADLLDQLENCYRKLERMADGILLGDGYRFDVAASVLYHNGEAVLLTRKELDLLELLARNADHVVPYSVLQKQVWQNVIVEKSSLRSLLKRIRHKAPALRITTVRGVGLMLQTPRSSDHAP